MHNYAVVGYPISHSKSPQIHSLFAQQTGQDICYQTLELSTQEFVSGVQRFFSQGGKGLNVTVPHKVSAYAMADQLTERAKSAGAVNTLWLDQGKIYADNTDGFGLVFDINRLVQDFNLPPLRQAKVLILGAGGAVQGVLRPILQQQPKTIVIANRTLSKALQLVKKFDQGDTEINVCEFSNLPEQHFDWIINATAASLQGTELPLPTSLINKDSCCYDMMYGAKTTVFNAWARHNGAHFCYDGLGMLVAQAAESFNIWRGVMPDIKPVLKQIRQELKG